MPLAPAAAVKDRAGAGLEIDQALFFKITSLVTLTYPEKFCNLPFKKDKSSASSALVVVFTRICKLPSAAVSSGFFDQLRLKRVLKLLVYQPNDDPGNSGSYGFFYKVTGR
jgi:hypothetical protein